MSRSLPAGMAAQITATGSTPTLSVLASQYELIPHLLADTGLASDLNYKTHLVQMSSGTIIQTLVDQSISPSTLKIRRITSPTTAAQWTATPTTIATGVQPLAGARAVDLGGTSVRLTYQRASDLKMVARDSTDDAITWSAEFIIGPGTLPLITGNIVDDIVFSGAADLFISVRAFSGLKQGASAMAHTRWTGSSWTAWSLEQPAPYPASSVGFGQIRSVDFIPNNPASPSSGGTFIAGIQRLNTLTGIALGYWTWNGSTHAYPQYIAPNDTPDIGISHIAAAAGSGSGTSYALDCLVDDGSVSGNPHTRAVLYSRPSGTTGPFAWHPLAAFPSTAVSTYGDAMLLVGTVLYVANGKTVYTLDTAAVNVTSELNSDVLGISISEKPNTPTRARILLSNHDGAYTSVQWAAYSLAIGLGYAGDTVECWTLYVEDYRLVFAGDKAIVELDCIDASLFLGRISNRFQSIAQASVGSLLSTIATTAGLSIATDGSSPFTSTVPCFVIKPGDSGLDSLNRLADLYDLTWFLSPTSTLLVIDLASRASDTSVWSYGQETLAIATGQSIDQPNVIRVVGGTATAWSEIQDDTAIATTGTLIYRHIADRLITTAAQAKTRAQQALRTEQRTTIHAQLTVTINPSLTLCDVIDITDPRLSLTNARYRIEGIVTTIDWAAGTWQQAVDLATP